jgi:hypothetical protein
MIHQDVVEHRTDSLVDRLRLRQQKTPKKSALRGKLTLRHRSRLTSEAAFEKLWRRMANCDHAWGQRVGEAQFCSKCGITASENQLLGLDRPRSYEAS